MADAPTQDRVDIAITVEGKTYRVAQAERDMAAGMRRAAALVETHAQNLASSGLSPTGTSPSRFFLMTAMLVAEDALARGAASEDQAGALARTLEQQSFERAVAEVLAAAAARIESLADRLDRD